MNTFIDFYFFHFQKYFYKYILLLIFIFNNKIKENIKNSGIIEKIMAFIFKNMNT